MRRRGRAVALAAIALLGCAHPSAGAECPGALVPVASLGPDFLARERVRHTAHGVEARLELAVQKRGAELVVVGIDPVGAVLFTATQRGDRAEMDALPRAVQPVAPRNLLRDLHRARFAAAPEGEPGVEVERDGARVRVRNRSCGSETVFTRISEQAL